MNQTMQMIQDRQDDSMPHDRRTLFHADHRLRGK